MNSSARRKYKRSTSGGSLNALRAANEWLQAQKFPFNRFAQMKPADRSKHLCKEYRISRRHLDQAIRDLKEGIAHPSEAFINAVAMAKRILQRELTAGELRGQVRLILSLETEVAE